MRDYPPELQEAITKLRLVGSILAWLPPRDNDVGEFASGWNRCLDYIYAHREGREP